MLVTFHAHLNQMSHTENFTTIEKNVYNVCSVSVHSSSSRTICMAAIYAAIVSISESALPVTYSYNAQKKLMPPYLGKNFSCMHRTMCKLHTQGHIGHNATFSPSVQCAVCSVQSLIHTLFTECTLARKMRPVLLKYSFGRMPITSIQFFKEHTIFEKEIKTAITRIG